MGKFVLNELVRLQQVHKAMYSLHPWLYPSSVVLYDQWKLTSQNPLAYNIIVVHILALAVCLHEHDVTRRSDQVINALIYSLSFELKWAKPDIGTTQRGKTSVVPIYVLHQHM